MAECLSAQAIQLPRASSLEARPSSTTDESIQTKDNGNESSDELSLEEKMVMLQDQGASGKDSATLLRDILQKEKQQHHNNNNSHSNNNNAGEQTEDSGTDDKAPSPMQSPMSSQSEEIEDWKLEDVAPSKKDEDLANLKSSGPLSPGLSQPAVNGCKKRKLYQPSRQTVENGDSLVINDDEDELDVEVPVKRSEDREALRARIREHYDRLTERGRLGDMKPVIAGGEHSDGFHSHADLERLVTMLKSEITHTLTQVIDNIVSRFVPRFQADHLSSSHHHNHHSGVVGDARAHLASTGSHHQIGSQALRSERGASPPLAPAVPLRPSHPPSFDLARHESLMAFGGPLANHQRELFAQMLDRKAKSKVIDRGGRTPRNELQNISASSKPMFAGERMKTSTPNASPALPLKRSESPTAGYGGGDSSPPPPSTVVPGPEQTEAMSLVVTPGKKKRHKVTDTRLAPRRSDSPKFGESPSSGTALVPSYPPPLIPVSLPTSVAIPNPSLHHDLFHLPHFDHQQRLSAPFQSGQQQASSQQQQAAHQQQQQQQRSSESPVSDPSSNRASTTPAAAPPSSNLSADTFGIYLQRAGLNKSLQDNTISERESLSESGTEPNGGAPIPLPYDMMNIFKYINGAGGAGALGALGTNSPFCPRTGTPGAASHEGSATPASETSSYSKNGSLGGTGYTSTLTPMHLRKAKLMFFYVRYPSSAILKMYFPDINFNKNNTAQLVKWFSNFREFYYIQMEKYARQAISEGIRNADEIRVSHDSELLRVLNLHYNRNNHIDVPENFRFVVEQTLREFFKSILAGKDQEQSWKKAIYKIIARLDDNVPEYFKSPNFLEQLE
ncbi:uncharacterized protein LOC100900938 [Galendromus occidentalis]|uniref:Homeobox protein prospero n=1 Tax=Galendromus occidentalis TaxID=34638 RepID=A0AAJ6QWT3_9ACAR|nr:uncharacterized protein LOC100900938 [Galendromus occidentalis]